MCWRIESLVREQGLGVDLEGAPGGSELAVTRRGVGNPRKQALQCIHLADQLLDGIKGFLVILQGHQEDFLVLTHADAGLRRFDAPAADALPGGDRISHGFSA